MPLKTLVAIPGRMVLTAYCFAQFAVQVLWLGKWKMPRIIKNGQDAIAQRKKALFAAHRNVVIYLNTLSKLDLVKFHSEGTPSKEPCVVVANHPSLLDFIYFLKDFPNAICLYKSQSLDNPVLSTFVQVAGYIEGMDGTSGASKRIIASCMERISEGHHVALFPEGSRSPGAKQLLRFRSTGFHAALKSGVAVQPVAIYCKPLFLGKNQPWIEFCQHRNHMLVRYLPVIRVEDLPTDKQHANGLADAARQSIEQALNEMEVQADSLS